MPPLSLSRPPRPTDPAGSPDGRESAMKERAVDGFGARLAALRQSRGLSQEALAAEVGVSRRVIAYYEARDAQPPGALLGTLARALKSSSDALLGLAPVTHKTAPKTARLLKRLQRIEELPPADQRAVLKLVDAMLETRRRSTPTGRKRHAS
jgi:transcriptional regulator with XRE-family HTH domain